MALYNLAGFKTATLGVADVVFSAPVTALNTFPLAGVPNGATVTYMLENFDGGGSVDAREVGRGVWNSGTLTLARTTVVDSTNGGAKIVLGGNAEARITAIAQDFSAAAVGAPALVSPSVVGNFVSFSNVTGSQADSGFSGASFQPIDATLTSIAALGTAANKMIYTTALDTWAEADLSAFARTMLDDANAAAVRTTIGAGTGNGDLLAANNLSDLTNAATARTNLGLGAAALLAVPITAANGGTGIANGASATLALPNLAITLGGGGAAQIYTLPAAGGTFALLNAVNTFTGTNLFTVFSGLQAYLNGVTSNFIAGLGSGKVTMSGTNNVFIGNATATSMTSGSLNVGIGGGALFALTSGSSNFGLGRDALVAITTTSGNVGIGDSALRNGAALSDTVGIGTSVGQSISGTQNVFIGVKAAGLGGAVRSGVDENVIIGYEAAKSLDADQNVVIGNSAALSLTTGSRNVIFGFSAGYRQTTTSDLFIIDNKLRATAAVEVENAYIYGSMAAGGFLQLNIPTTTNNAVINAFKLQAYVSTGSTGSANGFGVGLPFYAETATDATYQQQGLISTSWIDSTNASRKAKMSLSAYDTAARLGIEIEASGSAVKLGFFGATTVTKPTSTTDLRQAFIDLGLYTTGGATPLDLNGGALKAGAITNDTGLAHGTYTPTRSAEANLDSNVTVTEAQYMRVGNTVVVSGRFAADPTLPATTTSFEITLPVASNIGAVEDLAGTAFCGNIASQGAEVTGSVANNTAVVTWKSGDTTSQSWSYIFAYQVI